MRLFLMQGVPSSTGMMDWGILGWQGPGLWLMELVCLVMICLWMCPMTVSYTHLTLPTT